MSISKSVGDFGEERAAIYLVEHGAEVLARNYRTRRGELDIVASDAETLCFVEVRLREDDRFGAPSETVSVTKQRRLYYAAMEYLLKQCQHMNAVACRFDVISIERTARKITWIRNAFVWNGQSDRPM